MQDVRSTYLRTSEIEYMREHNHGLSYKVGFAFKTEEATKWVEFIDGYGNSIKKYDQADFNIKLRYAYKERFYQTKGNRYPINKTTPIIMLNHGMGWKGFLNSKYNYQRTDLTLQKAFWFSTYGHINSVFIFSKVWTKTPYTALIIPDANLSYTIRTQSFSLLNPIEFVFDNYAAWDIEYFANEFGFLKPLMYFVEVTTAITKTNNIYLISFLLGFSNLCIWAQVLAISRNISIKILDFAIFRILHGLISAFLTFILLKIFPVPISTFSTTYSFTSKALVSNKHLSISLLILGVIFIISLSNRQTYGKILEEIL